MTTFKKGDIVRAKKFGPIHPLPDRLAGLSGQEGVVLADGRGYQESVTDVGMFNTGKPATFQAADLTLVQSGRLDVIPLWEELYEAQLDVDQHGDLGGLTMEQHLEGFAAEVNVLNTAEKMRLANQGPWRLVVNKNKGDKP